MANLHPPLATEINLEEAKLTLKNFKAAFKQDIPSINGEIELQFFLSTLLAIKS